MAVDSDKLVPQFADSWYDTPPVSELRQELQHMYEQIKNVNQVSDADTLDGLDSTQFLRSDVSDTKTGLLISESSGVNVEWKLSGYPNFVRFMWPNSTTNSRFLMVPYDGAYRYDREFEYNFGNARWQVEGGFAVDGNLVWHAGNFSPTVPPVGEFSASVGTAGWYTIANVSTGRAYGEFYIYDRDSGKHGFTKVIATTSYGKNELNLIHGDRYNTETIKHVRILYSDSDRTYGGAKLQVYGVNPSWTMRVRAENTGINGWESWTLVNPVNESVTGWTEDVRVSNVTNDDNVSRVYAGKFQDSEGGGYTADFPQGWTMGDSFGSGYYHINHDIGSTDYAVAASSVASTIIVSVTRYTTSFIIRTEDSSGNPVSVTQCAFIATVF